MTSVRFLFEPLDDGPGGPDIPTKPQINSAFDTKWSDTLADLDREVWHLGGRTAVIQLDVRRRDIRQDGQMRADVRVGSPRVRVSFESRHGPMSLSSGRFVRRPNTAPDWQHNIRAIALTLESLRRVDRYGVVQGGEQYRGFLAIEAAPTGELRDPFTNADEAAEWLRGLVQPHEAHPLGRALRVARGALHPDLHGGDRSSWDRLDRAVVLLEAGGLL